MRGNQKNPLLRALTSLAGTALLVSPALAYTELDFADQAVNLTPGESSRADKARLLAMPDGTLAVFWHAQTGVVGQAWDVFGQSFAPRDIYVAVSSDGGSTWSSAVNLSNTSSLTDPAEFYDRIGDGSGLANFYGDADKPSIFANGSNVTLVWSDTYCGPGRHGPARYEVEPGYLEVPYRCLYAARMTIKAGGLDVVAVQQLTDASRDVTNEVLRGTGAGFATAWQEDPNGLQLGEARGEGDGSSGARTSPGTDIWYAWMPMSAFADPAQTWKGPIAISDNYDYDTQTVTGGGGSRPILALAGSPPTALLVYEEAKNAGPEDRGKYVRFHEFPFSAPPASEAGTIISNPLENARRARVISAGSPGPLGTRMVLMWRQGIGIMGAPADFMMRLGRVPPGTDLATSPTAGFRSEDLWPPVDATDPSQNAAPLNLSGGALDDESSVDPLSNAKAHRAVLDGDFIFAGYTQDEDTEDPAGLYQYYGRWSADGGSTWSPPLNVSAQGSGAADVIEPRLLRTPSVSGSSNPEDVRNPDVYLFAWGTQSTPTDGSEPVRESLYVTRTMDRGLTLEPTQTLDGTRTGSNQTDEQIQLKISPDGQQVAAVWVRREGELSSIAFATAQGVTRTADLSMTGESADFSPDVGVEVAAGLTVRNAGPDVATDTVLEIAVDPGLAVTGVSHQIGSCAIGAPIVCSLGSLGPAATARVILKLVAEDARVYELSAVVAAREVEPTPGDNQVALRFEWMPNADLAVNGAARIREATEGSTFSIDFSVSNHGPQTATDIHLFVRVSRHVRVEDAGGCVTTEQGLDCALPSLAPGEAYSHRMVIVARSLGTARIVASAAAAEADPVAANDDASVAVQITGVSGGCAYSPQGSGQDATLMLLLLIASLRILALAKQQIVTVKPHD